MLQATLAAFKWRDLYVAPSQRWGDHALHEAVRIERTRGRQELVLLDKLGEQPSLLALKTLVAQRLPRVELPELLLEVQAWTGFASDFTHVNEQGARADDLPISVCAVLLAEACNVGLEPLVRPDIQALTRARLAWIQQWPPSGPNGARRGQCPRQPRESHLSSTTRARRAAHDACWRRGPCWPRRLSGHNAGNCVLALGHEHSVRANYHQVEVGWRPGSRRRKGAAGGG